jgi:formylglycine-generating enzyme
MSDFPRAPRSRHFLPGLACAMLALLGCASGHAHDGNAAGNNVGGGNAGNGASSGTAGLANSGGSGATGGGAEGGGGEIEWHPGPSCDGLPANCGPDQQQDCCASHVVPGGTFLRDNGGPGSFKATLSDFRLDDYEVTVGRFRNLVAGYANHRPEVGSGRNPSNDLDPGWDARWNDSLPADEAELIANVQVCDARFATFAADDATLPMNCITWFEAYAFCIWDGGRLPTDAETNYAAAGGAEQRIYPWSDPPESDEIDAAHATYLPEAEGPARVGSKSPLGDGKWGQADLSGNEWEWCQDWYRTYPTRCINCADLAMDYTIRVIRGGDFYTDRESLYTSSRLYHAPNQPDFGVGVRCARTP